ncbi:MAG: hypothetical protein HKN28_01820 [Alphaproteobacteria bacterium]|nr:hypothetical protein [Alphaproteobacteria bacterium]
MRQDKPKLTDRTAYKVSRRLIGFSLLTLSALTVSPAAFAESHNPPPSFSCGFRGLEPVSPAHFETNNLEQLTLVPSLFDNGHRVEKMFDAAEAKRHQVDDTPTLEITVTSLNDDRGKVRIRTPSSGGGGGGGYHRKTVNLSIPISIEQLRDGYERWYQRILELENPDGDKKRTEELKARLRTKKVKEGAFVYVGGSVYENEPGLYRKNCSYRSSKQGFWNGETEAEPITLRIHFVEAAFDRFLPAAEPTK